MISELFCFEIPMMAFYLPKGWFVSMWDLTEIYCCGYSVFPDTVTGLRYSSHAPRTCLASSSSTTEENNSYFLGKNLLFLRSRLLVEFLKNAFGEDCANSILYFYFCGRLRDAVYILTEETKDSMNKVKKVLISKHEQLSSRIIILERVSLEVTSSSKHSTFGMNKV